MTLENPDAEPAEVTETAPPVEPAPLLTLRHGIPPVIDTAEALAAARADLAGASGPVAVDAERASGYRYSGRAYLIQLRRDGSRTHLIDPLPFGSLDSVAEALDGAEYIIHAATQDIVCLREVGLVPTKLFDTELAGRLLGYPRVGLATLVESVLGFSLKKEHSAADWSTRPLPQPWLEYAALDVEVLVELRDALAAELAEAGKDEWARQEFEALLDFTPAVRTDAWRRTSGMHKVRGRRGLGAVREMWLTRDEIARERDVSPSRLIPDASIVAAALSLEPGRHYDRGAIRAIAGFHGRGAQRYAQQWADALTRAATMPEDELPDRAPRVEGPPLPRAWAERDPEAAARLARAREALTTLAESLVVPVENLISPDVVRRVLWKPPALSGDIEGAVAQRLRELGAREWQVEYAAPVLATAIPPV